MSPDNTTPSTNSAAPITENEQLNEVIAFLRVLSTKIQAGPLVRETVMQASTMLYRQHMMISELQKEIRNNNYVFSAMQVNIERLQLVVSGQPNPYTPNPVEYKIDDKWSPNYGVDGVGSDNMKTITPTKAYDPNVGSGSDNAGPPAKEPKAW